MARASEQEQTGSVGVSEAMGKFARIGFGFAEITRHDNGTDVFLLVRDARRFDLGLTLAAQVKGGASWFSEPAKKDDGSVAGWWFRDTDGEHIADWISYGLPHLLVMHDLDDDVTYWVHVTADAVVPTGKGQKILVPIEQRVDANSRDALIAIAASTRRAPRWEGSAWQGAESVLARDLLRYTLLAPRLIAPHPNVHISDPLTAYQAIAMCLQARIRELDELAKKQLVHNPTDAAASPEWPWNLYAAFHARLTDADVQPLLTVPGSAPNFAARSAAVIAAAGCLMEEGRADEAVSLLEELANQDAANPVDHAWLVAQLSRAYAEIGRIGEARELAASVQAIAVTNPEDVTATAIAGVGAALLFRLQDWSSGDVGRAIQASDTAVNWWRQQVRGWGLAAVLDRIFISWTRDKSMRWSASDVAHDQLLAASVNATLIGDQGAWRNIAGLLAKDTLVRLNRQSDPDAAQAGLSALRIAGLHQEVSYAVRRIVNDGPAVAATVAARNIDLKSLTHTTAQSSLMMLRRAGAVLDETTADGAIEWLIATLKDTASFEQRVQPTFLTAPVLIDTLAGVLHSASLQAHKDVAAYVASLDGITREVIATAWARAVRNLDPKAIADKVLSDAANTKQHHEMLQYAVRSLAATSDSAERDLMLREIEAGSPTALGEWREEYTALPADVAHAAALAAEARLVERRTRQAETGGTPVYAYDEPLSLAFLNLRDDRRTSWRPLIEFLSDDAIDSDQKSGVLSNLAAAVDRVPSEVVEQLRSVAASMLTSTTEPDFPLADTDAAVGAAALFLAVTEHEPRLTDNVVALLAGNSTRRLWAARIAWYLARSAGPMAIGFLIALSHDDDPGVRAAAAAGLVGVCADGSGDSVVVAAVEECLNDCGLVVPLAMATRLSESGESAETLPWLLDRLLTSPFRIVRIRATTASK